MRNEQNKSTSYVALTIFTLLLLGLIVLYVLEFPFLTNTKNVLGLVKSSLTIGAIVTVVALVLGYVTKVLHKASIRLHVFFSLAFLAFTPFFASITNRKFSNKSPYSQAYEYKGQKGYFMELFVTEKKPKFDTYWLYLQKDNEEFAFRTNTELPRNPNFGSKVRLMMNRGFWGFDYFDGKSWEFM